MKNVINFVGAMGLGMMLTVAVAVLMDVAVCGAISLYMPTQLGFLNVGDQEVCVGAWGVVLGDIFGGR